MLVNKELNNYSLVEEFELVILKDQLKDLRAAIEAIDSNNTNEETRLRIHAACVKYVDDYYLDQDKQIDPKKLAALGEIVDKIANKEHDLNTTIA